MQFGILFSFQTHRKGNWTAVVRVQTKAHATTPTPNAQEPQQRNVTVKPDTKTLLAPAVRFASQIIAISWARRRVYI